MSEEKKSPQDATGLIDYKKLYEDMCLQKEKLKEKIQELENSVKMSQYKEQQSMKKQLKSKYENQKYNKQKLLLNQIKLMAEKHQEELLNVINQTNILSSQQILLRQYYQQLEKRFKNSQKINRELFQRVIGSRKNRSVTELVNQHDKETFSKISPPISCSSSRRSQQ